MVGDEIKYKKSELENLGVDISFIKDSFRRSI